MTMNKLKKLSKMSKMKKMKNKKKMRKKLFSEKGFVMKSRVVEIFKEVKRSDSLWRFACGNVYFLKYF